MASVRLIACDTEFSILYGAFVRTGRSGDTANTIVMSDSHIRILERECQTAEKGIVDSYFGRVGNREIEHGDGHAGQPVFHWHKWRECS